MTTLAKARPREVGSPLTPQRLAKGDLASYTPREFVPGRDGNPGQWRELAPVNRVRARYESPLVGLLNRGSITGKMFHAGITFADAYELRHREQSSINLNGAGGGWKGGLTHGQCEAQDVLDAAWRALPVFERDDTWDLLIAVCVQHYTIREIAGPSGHARDKLGTRLFVALRHMAGA